MHRKYNFLKEMKNLSTKKIFFLFIICLFFTSYIYTIIFKTYAPDLLDINGNYIITNIGFVFGKTISSLLNGNNLSINLNDFLSTWGLKSNIEMELTTSRRPLLPLTYIFIYKYITTNFVLFHLVKNIFFGLLIFLAINSLKKKKNNLFLIFCLLLVYYNPHNTVTMLSTQFEEGLLNYLIILLFIICISEVKYKEIYISLALIFIFFLKGSMFLLVIVISIFYFFYEKKNKLKILIILSVLASNLYWGYFNYNKTGLFTFGIKGSSMNAINMTLVTNNLFNKIYPEILPDILMGKVVKILEENNIQNEKVLTNFLTKRSIDYIKKNPIEFFNGVLKKIYILCFSPFKDALMPGSKIYDGFELKQSSTETNYDIYLSNIENGNERLNPKIINPIRYSNFSNKIIFNFSIFLMFFSFIYKKNSRFFISLNLYYFMFLLTYLAPYMYGWIYPRHATSIYTLAHLYSFLYLIEKKDSFKKLFKQN